MPNTATEQPPVQWTKVRLNPLVTLLNHVPVRLRWKWRKKREAGRPMLCLVSPRGAWWRCKLDKGLWITGTKPPIKIKKGSVPSICKAAGLTTADVNTTD
jgi:hypothetical protein